MTQRRGPIDAARSALEQRRPVGHLRRGLLTVGAAGLFFVGASLGTGSVGEAAPVQALAPTARNFLSRNCLSCHNKKNSSGGLDLAVAYQPDDPKNFNLWVKVVDRVAAGEMPPKSAPQPAPAARKAFLAAVSTPLQVIDEGRMRREGRSTWRRMNRYEYENTVRDLLDAPWLQIREMLPEDGLLARFNKVGDALDVSHVQMSRYLSAASYALKEVLPTQVTRPETTKRRYYAREQRSFAGLARFGRFNQASERATFAIFDNKADVPAMMRTAPFTVGEQDPVKREMESIGVVASAYEPLMPRFDQFRAPVAGRYKLRLRAHTFWSHPDNPDRWWRPSRSEISKGRTQEPVSLYSSLPQGVTQILRKLGTLDFGPEASVGGLDVHLLQGETILPDAARLFRSRPPNWHNPLATPEGQPGVGFNWMEVEGPLYDNWPTRGQLVLTGGLPLKSGSDALEIVSTDPVKDGERLLRAFTRRAVRRPIADVDIQPCLKVFHAAQKSGSSFTEALLTAYSAVLCSPAFVTLEERPGPLDAHALASRLSYLLWNTEPDATLRALADKGVLTDPKVLISQTDRLLADPRSQRFSEAFLDYWLDLRKTGNTNPDETLYPDYYLDDLLVESSIDETRAFFSELIRGNLPARNLVTSDFVMVNSRLAELYGINDVKGSEIRRVPLPADSVRGGLLTQASVLKVTANGTTTSPVIRGAWITERILGLPVPPPPAAVPAVEPDIRGATTIREQLDKHRSLPACNSCHSRIDPPGFALESFDIFGGWRSTYRALGEGPKVPGFGKNGQPFVFTAALPVDPSGVLADGRAFKDIRELKKLLVRDERQIARNLVRQLVTYGTGAPVRFGDRPSVESILDGARSDGYGVKSLIHGLVSSRLFRSK